MQVQGERVLDLGEIDAHPQQPEDKVRYGWRWLVSTRVSALAAVGLLLLGGVVGGLGTYSWQTIQRRQAAESAVSVLVFIEPESSAIGSRSGQQLRIAGRLLVVNTGPLPLDIRNLWVDEQWIKLHNTGQLHVLAGALVSVHVTVMVNCAIRQHPQHVAVQMLVETVRKGSQQASYPMAVRGTRWYGFVDEACPLT